MSNVVTKDARMELKTTSALKQMLGSAAALVGQDLSSFVLVSAEERAMLLQRLRAGDTHAEAAAHVGCSAKSVQRLLQQTGGVPRRIAMLTAVG
jgi:DNA-directed RNA polymerase specialized sigma24 family protein